MEQHTSNINRYRILCSEREDIPLFLQAWWMDAVCIEGKSWDVILWEDDGKIIGAMPYHLITKWGFRVILQPQQTQFNGIWIDYPPEQKAHKRYSFEQKVMESIITELEKLNLSYYSQNFHHSFTNWQPFYWKGFQQTTRYTYQIKDLTNQDKILADFSYSKRTRITNQEQLFVDFSLSPEEFYSLHSQTLLQRKSKIEYSRNLFVSIHNAAKSRNCGQIIAIKDGDDNFHSAIFIVWDKNSAYNLITAINLSYKTGVASTRMFWEAIKLAATKSKTFDFEGSMIKGVAQSFQQFGAEQVPYFNISKSYSRTYSFLSQVKNRKNR